MTTQTDNLDIIEKAEFDTTRHRDLNATDRCDRCGAQAYVIGRKGLQELLFCGHHGRKFTPGLVGAGFMVEDNTALLTEDRLTGSEN